MKLAGRKVRMIRTHLTPMLGQKPLLAYMFPEQKWGAVVNDSENGVIVTIPAGHNVKKEEQWFVPFTNIQVVQFENEEPVATKKTEKSQNTAKATV